MSKTEDELLMQRLLELIRSGLKSAGQVLSAMATQPISLEVPNVQRLPLRLVPNIAGGPDREVVAAYLGVEGELVGHLVLMFPLDTACRLVDFLMAQNPGTTHSLDDMGMSAIAEAGNICGSHFLNALSNGTALKIVPTAPSLVVDMAGAILESVVTHIMLGSDEAVMVETRFGGEISGHFLLLPVPDSMSKMMAALGATV